MNTPSLLRVVGLLLLVCSFTGSRVLAGSIADELNPSQLGQVKAGTQLTITEEVPGHSWPKVKVYRTIKATPEEVAAVFLDYKHAKEYVPNVLKSDIAAQPSPNTCDVDYGIDVPILPDEYYTVRTTVTSEGPAYKFHWKLLKAIQTKDSDGTFRMEPFEGGSLISYQNLVTPGSSMAGLLRGKAISQMKDTVDAIATRVEKQKASNPADLKREIDALHKALGAN